MPVITISREVGSQGTVIGKRIANELNYRYVDKDLIAEVLEEYGFLDFERVYEAAQGFWDRFDKRTTETVEMLNRVIRALAHHGDLVIMGRGSFAVLHGLADVFNVRVQAPMPYRVLQVMASEQLTDREPAEFLVQVRDRARAEFVEMAYHLSWDTARAFDLVIDTSKVPPEKAVAWVVELVKALPARYASDIPTTQQLEVDPVLAEFLSTRYLTVT